MNQLAEADKNALDVFESFDCQECRAGEFSELGQFPVQLAASLRAGEAGQRHSFLACPWNVVQQQAHLVEPVADGVGKWPLQTFAQGFPIRLAFEDKAVHPAVALGEHIYQYIFKFLPVVVTPLEEFFDGLVKWAMGWVADLFISDLLQGAAGGAAIEIVGL